MKMKLMNAQLARAEWLSFEERKQYDLPAKGMIVIETWASYKELKLNMVSCPSICDYLRRLGPFNDVPIKED
jgi:hypothetical protein